MTLFIPGMLLPYRTTVCNRSSEPGYYSRLAWLLIKPSRLPFVIAQACDLRDYPVQGESHMSS